MSELPVLLRSLFSSGLELALLLALFLAGVMFVTLVIAPFESLHWWAGWVSDLPSPAQPGGDLQRVPPRAPPRAGSVEAVASPGAGLAPLRYVVFLPGVGALGTQIDRWEQRLVDLLAARLRDSVVLAGIFPFTVRHDDVLIEGRSTAWFWRGLAWLRSRYPSLLARLIDWRNLTQVFVSADPRYGPIFSLGVSEKLRLGLTSAGYVAGSGMPIVLVGYSGAAQVALGAARYLSRQVEAPVTVVSLGGVIGDDPSLETVEHLHHLWGARDAEARLAALVVPSRWPLVWSSRWNRARAERRLSDICLGAIAHTGRGSYLDPDTVTADGRTYLEVTIAAIVEVIDPRASPAPVPFT
jgi:hypothetical protein